MGDNDIPVPAESLRRMSEGATEAIRNARDDDRKATARDLQRKVAEALEGASGKDGEFVSVSADTAATLAAFGGGPAYGRVPEAMRHNDAVRHYLEQYDYW